MASPADTAEYANPVQASKVAGIGVTAIRDAVKSGDLAAYRKGSRVLIKLDDLREWVERDAYEPPAA